MLGRDEGLASAESHDLDQQRWRSAPTRPDEMLVVWRRPDGSVAEALKDATFAKGDKVICAE